ncbi:hypothetical protein V1512DRAFT_262393 [Lipomyces arxii]|uniref:uncharacterized protein n=1 Tax=Lipomyces arxii TaxID=56418 RepID=UPI0034CEF786
MTARNYNSAPVTPSFVVRNNKSANLLSEVDLSAKVIVNLFDSAILSKSAVESGDEGMIKFTFELQNDVVVEDAFQSDETASAESSPADFIPGPNRHAAVVKYWHAGEENGRLTPPAGYTSAELEYIDRCVADAATLSPGSTKPVSKRKYKPCAECARSKDAVEWSQIPDWHSHHVTAAIFDDFSDEVRSEYSFVDDDNETEHLVNYLAEFLDRRLGKTKHTDCDCVVKPDDDDEPVKSVFFDS